VHRNFRKPLVITTPKSMLRAKEFMSGLAEMGPRTTFHRVFGESGELVADDKVRRVVLCSGKVYFDLLKARQERKIKDIALIRIEQLHPFPSPVLSEVLARYRNADVVWCQEEPQNMGAWTFVDRRLEQVLLNSENIAKRASYVGRPEAASPATGLLKRHLREQAKLVDEALTLK
jgi:2-oxoglutarate dehydrogenase E1 component